MNNYDDGDYEEIIERFRGKIPRGDCMYCGARNAMVYEGDVCFICDECGKSCHEDLYYLWAGGVDIIIDEDA